MRSSTLIFTILLAASSCKNDEENDAWKDDYTFVRHGDNVTLYGYGLDGSDACEGSFAALDIHTRSVMDLLGADENSQYIYRWMPLGMIEGLCPSWVPACTFYGEPYAEALPYMHEVVHMVGYDMPNSCTPLLEEGLGEYLGGPRYRESPALDYDILDLLEVRANPGPRGYLRAGHFVSFLIETYGVDGFRRLCTTAPQLGTLPGWDYAVRKALGISLHELLAEYESYPACTQQQYRAKLWECSGEPDFVFTADNDTYAFDAGCEDPRAMNTTPGELGDAVLRRLVYFTEEMAVDVTPGFGATFMSQECAPCTANPQVMRERENTLNRHIFRPGLHELVLFFDKTKQVHFRMHARPL